MSISNEFAVDPKDLIEDLSNLSNLKDGVSEATGELRSQIKQILDSRGYHKKALAMIRDLDAMSETKRADVLRTFLPMLNAMRDAKWDSEMKDMLDKLDDEEEEAE